ncbi:MAG: hypothetical protein VW876_17865, partial [Deltaproteobacteria bacterium]
MLQKTGGTIVVFFRQPKSNQIPYLMNFQRCFWRLTFPDGTLSEHNFPVEMPNLKGAGAEFILNVNLPHYSNEVINNCITSITEYFNVDNQQINQPIYTRELLLLIDRVPGVQTVN